MIVTYGACSVLLCTTKGDVCACVNEIYIKTGGLSLSVSAPISFGFYYLNSRIGFIICSFFLQIKKRKSCHFAINTTDM